MRASVAIAALGLVVVVGVCRPSSEVGTDSAAANAAQSLLAADREWARLTSGGRSVDSIMAYWDDDARVAIPGMPTVQGEEALRRMVAGNVATPGFRITWRPDSAVVSESGDFGYTFGSNEVVIPGPIGTPERTMAGRYLMVWRKGVDGRWRCVMNYSTPGVGTPMRPGP